jgi:hypothetical protein
MQDKFGARMRQHREQQGISIASIADRTKLKASVIEGLERDDISHWPAGIFRRAWIRTYAEAIGLDPKVVTREFLECHPDPVVEVDPVPDPPTGLRGLVGSAFGSLARRRRVAPPTVTPQPMIGTSGRAVAEPPPLVAETAEPVAPVATERLPRTAGERRKQRSRRSGDQLAAPLDLVAAADLCTALARVEDGGQILPLLRDAARLLDARGLIVWLWEPGVGELRPALVHGYSEKVIAQLPALRKDADNPTAEAFRSARTRTVSGSERASAALVVPLLTPAACAGVLAIELAPGGEQQAPVCAVATFFAATLALLVGSPAADEALPDVSHATQLA